MNQVCRNRAAFSPVLYNEIRREMEMQGEVRLKAEVLPGGRIEVADSELTVGDTVEVIVRQVEERPRRSALEILSEAPGHRLFKTEEDVRAYLDEEKASWHR